MKFDTSIMVTEQRNENSVDIDSKPIEEIIDIFNKEDQKAIEAVIKEKENIKKAIEIIVQSFNSGGRLFYVGAGTSGRLGVLDASECPPTFGVDRDMVQASSQAATRHLPDQSKELKIIPKMVQQQ